MKILNDLFSLLSGTGEEKNLKTLIEERPLSRIVIYLGLILMGFVALVATIVSILL